MIEKTENRRILFMLGSLTWTEFLVQKRQFSIYWLSLYIKFFAVELTAFHCIMPWNWLSERAPVSSWLATWFTSLNLIMRTLLALKLMKPKS